MSCVDIPDSKVHGANMGRIWGRQDPGGPHVGPMTFAICDVIMISSKKYINNSLHCISIYATACAQNLFCMTDLFSKLQKYIPLNVYDEDLRIQGESQNSNKCVILDIHFKIEVRSTVQNLSSI